MKALDVCFIGIGSIARRHVKNLKEISEERGIRINIDAVRRKDSLPVEEAEKFREIFTGYDGLPDSYDAIFITNPTEFHLDSLKKVLGKSKTFFIEKPLTSVRRAAEVKSLNIPEDVVCYVACPLRYTKVLQYLKTFLCGQKVAGVRCISSSYLPDWRPGIDYRDTYSANKALGGGVSIDLIHEWDYLKFLFGMPDEVVYRRGKKSSLEMDCEDTALYIAEYQDKFLELHLDYFGRRTVREIMIFTDQDTIVGDLADSQVTFQKSGRVIDFEQGRDDFQKAELVHFLEIIENRRSDNTIKDAYQTVLLTQGILED